MEQAFSIVCPILFIFQFLGVLGKSIARSGIAYSLIHTTNLKNRAIRDIVIVLIRVAA